MALTTHTHLAPRLKKEWICTFISTSGPSWPVLEWTFYCIVFLYFIKYNILFTYISSNILIIIGIIFSMLLGPEENLQDCECPVAVLSVISDDHLSSQHQDGYVIWQPTSQVGKEIKKNCFLWCGKCMRGGGMGTCDSVLNLKYFIHSAKCQWHAQKLLWPPNFLPFDCDPLEIWFGPWSPIWPTLSPTAVHHLK